MLTGQHGFETKLAPPDLHKSEKVGMIEMLCYRTCPVSCDHGTGE